MLKFLTSAPSRFGFRGPFIAQPYTSPPVTSVDSMENVSNVFVASSLGETAVADRADISQRKATSCSRCQFSPEKFVVLTDALKASGVTDLQWKLEMIALLRAIIVLSEEERSELSLAVSCLDQDPIALRLFAVFFRHHARLEHLGLVRSGATPINYNLAPLPAPTLSLHAGAPGHPPVSVIPEATSGTVGQTTAMALTTTGRTFALNAVGQKQSAPHTASVLAASSATGTSVTNRALQHQTNGTTRVASFISKEGAVAATLAAVSCCLRQYREPLAPEIFAPSDLEAPLEYSLRLVALLAAEHGELSPELMAAVNDRVRALLIRQATVASEPQPCNNCGVLQNAGETFEAGSYASGITGAPAHVASGLNAARGSGGVTRQTGAGTLAATTAGQMRGMQCFVGTAMNSGVVATTANLGTPSGGPVGCCKNLGCSPAGCTNVGCPNSGTNSSVATESCSAPPAPSTAGETLITGPQSIKQENSAKKDTVETPTVSNNISPGTILSDLTTYGTNSRGGVSFSEISNVAEGLTAPPKDDRKRRRHPRPRRAHPQWATTSNTAPQHRATVDTCVPTAQAWTTEQHRRAKREKDFHDISAAALAHREIRSMLLQLTRSLNRRDRKATTSNEASIPAQPITQSADQLPSQQTGHPQIGPGVRATDQQNDEGQEPQVSTRHKKKLYSVQQNRCSGCREVSPSQRDDRSVATSDFTASDSDTPQSSYGTLSSNEVDMGSPYVDSSEEELAVVSTTAPAAPIYRENSADTGRYQTTTTTTATGGLQSAKCMDGSENSANQIKYLSKNNTCVAASSEIATQQKVDDVITASASRGRQELIRGPLRRRCQTRPHKAHRKFKSDPNNNTSFNNTASTITSSDHGTSETNSFTNAPLTASTAPVVNDVTLSTVQPRDAPITTTPGSSGTTKLFLETQPAEGGDDSFVPSPLNPLSLNLVARPSEYGRPDLLLQEESACNQSVYSVLDPANVGGNNSIPPNAAVNDPANVSGPTSDVSGLAVSLGHPPGALGVSPAVLYSSVLNCQKVTDTTAMHRWTLAAAAAADAAAAPSSTNQSLSEIFLNVCDTMFVAPTGTTQEQASGGAAVPAANGQTNQIGLPSDLRHPESFLVVEQGLRPPDNAIRHQSDRISVLPPPPPLRSDSSPRKQQLTASQSPEA